MSPRCVIISFVTSWMALASTTPATERPLQSQSSQFTGARLSNRIWTDRSGTREAEALLLKVVKEHVYLRKLNGKLSVIDLDQLSRQDQRYIADMKVAVSSPNPSLAKRESSVSANPRAVTSPALPIRQRDRCLTVYGLQFSANF